MKIGRRLSVSFLLILFLFAVNLFIYFWGNQRRQSSVEALRRAVSRQGLLSAINQNLSDIQKQMTLLSQVPTETLTARADPAEVAQFNGQLQNIEREVDGLRKSAEPDHRADIAAFARVY